MNFKYLLLALLMFGLTSSVHAASIKGTATYEGKIPKLRTINMGADPICLAKHTEDIFPDVLVLGEGQTMANVFVHVKTGVPKKSYPTPTEPLVLDQKGCLYTPHVSGVMVNQEVKILNPDGTLHNVHAIPKVNDEFNIAMPKFRKEITRTFDKVEFMFPLKCDVHPWMTAYISVMDHPYFDSTEKDGAFEINDLPPGEYEIEAWHEKLGVRSSKVTIADATEEVVVDFTFARPDKK